MVNNNIIATVGIAGTLSLQLFCGPQLINPETHRATPFFRQQLTTVGIPLGQPPEKQNPAFPSDHVSNLNATLQHFCFQKDYDHWLKGGTGRLSISEDQATKYLKEEYETYQETMPDLPSTTIDVIIPGGVRATVVKRLRSYASLYDKKRPNIGRVHFLIKDEEAKAEIEAELQQEAYSRYFRGVECLFTVGEEPNNILASAARRVKERNAIVKDYVIVGDQVFAEGLQSRLSPVLGKEHKCHGYVFSPTKDYKEDMLLYGYTSERLGSEAAATIALALSNLNFKSRAAHALEQKRLKEQK